MKVVVSELKIIRSTRKAKNTNEIDGTESKVESFGAEAIVSLLPQSLFCFDL
jgi:hypothetical protein